MEEVFDKIRIIISDKFGVAKDEITSTSDLAGDLNLSNIEINDLIALTAKEFNFEIPEHNDIENVKSVSDVINIVENYAELI